MCFFKKSEPPQIPIIITHATEMMKVMGNNNVDLLYAPMDTEYYHTSPSGWLKVFDYIYSNKVMPKYIAERMDCEDFAMWLKAMVSLHFGLNWFAFIIGDSPMGRHGFNAFYDGSLWLLEPQDKDHVPFKIGDNGYTPLFAVV